jgi:hypothetical protein
MKKHGLPLQAQALREPARILAQEFAAGDTWYALNEEAAGSEDVRGVNAA